MNLIDGYFSEKTTGQQLVIAGAGFDALGIEVMEFHPHVKVFELDRDNMSIKSSIFEELNNGSSKGITLIDVDLLNTSAVYRSLAAHGWKPTEPTVLLLEGISYYLPADTIQRLVQVIKPGRLILEFLKQDEDIAPDRISIPNEVFGTISRLCGLSHIRKYNYSQLEQLLSNLSIVTKCSMKRLEELRTGSNRFFPTEDSGWIEVYSLTGEERENMV
ncbi:MAG: class I SAM-dependent methyltransferase [Kiritimatiellia bacterium]|nr:class I SAM-dependent methyltransferase [Kiritimatiellia bacterium]